MKIFRPAAIAVQKKVIVGCRSAQTATRLGSASIQFGLGQTLLSLDGWTAAAAVTAWNNADHPLLSAVSISTYISSGWYEAVLLTSNSRGDDFRINFLVDDEIELVMNETHRVSFVGRTGSIDILFHTPIGDLSVTSFSVTDLDNSEIQIALQEAILDIPGLENGDITVAVTGSSSSLVLSFSFAGKFTGITLDLTEVNTENLFQPTATQATLQVLQLGSTGADHKVGLAFQVQPEYSYSDEVQVIAASDAPAPSEGTFVLYIAEVEGSTAPIAWDATAGEVQSAIEAVPGMLPGIITCTGGPLPENPITFTFGFLASDTNVSEILVDDSGLALSGPSPTITITEVRKGRAAGAGVNEEQSVTLESEVNSGTIRLRLPAGTWSDAIDVSANAATAQTALETALGVGNCIVTGGPLLSDPFLVEFTGVLAESDQPLLLSDADVLTDIVVDVIDYITPDVIWDDWRIEHIDPRLNGTVGTITFTGIPTVTATTTLTWPNPYNISGSSVPSLFTLSISSNWTYRQLVEAMDEVESNFLFAHPECLDTVNINLRVFPAIDMMTQSESLLNSSNQLVFRVFCPSFFSPTYNNQWDYVSLSQWSNSQNSGVNDNSASGYAFCRGSLRFIYVLPDGSIEFSNYVDVNAITSTVLNDVLTSIPSLDTDEVIIRGGVMNFGSSSVLAPVVYRTTGHLNLSIDWSSVEVRTTPTWRAVVPASDLVFGTFTIAGAGNNFRRQGFDYIGTIPGDGTVNITFALDGDENTVEIPFNCTYQALQLRLPTLGTASGGPLGILPLVYTIDKMYAGYTFLSATYIPSNVVSVIEETPGYSDGVAIDEQQQVTLNNTTGGTYTLSDGINTTTDILATASSLMVKNALLAAEIEVSSVTGSVLGPYLITFTGSHGADDIDMLIADDTELTNDISPQPSLSIETIVEGGVGTIIGGLLGGTFDLRLTRTIDTVSDVFYVRALAFNISNAALKAAIEAIIGETIVVTGGQLPGTDVQIEFTDSIGSTHWLVEVIPNLNIEGGSGGVITTIRSAANPSPENVWDLEIIPGTDTPGIREVSLPDDWGYLILKIETPSGTLSSSAHPQSPITGEQEKTREPSLVKIKWIDLTAEMLEELINEAMGEIVCRVVQPIQSIEHADFNVTIPVPSGVGSVETRVKCWYMRSVFRIIFCGDFHSAGSISNIAVELPLREDGNVIDVRDFMVIDDNSPSQNSNISTFEDVLGQDAQDAAKENARIAGAFYLAQLGGEPIHSFGIYRSHAQGILSWRFKLLDHYVIESSEWENERFGVAEHRPFNVRFHWVQRGSAPGSAIYNYRMLASSEMLPFDASTSQIKESIGAIVPGWFGTDNIEVLGSLYNSYTSDTFDPAIGIPSDVPTNTGFTGLQVSLIGDLLYQPFNEYSLHLVMSIERRDSNNTEPTTLWFYRSSNFGPTREDIEDMPMVHFESLADCPIPLQVNSRIHLSPEGPGPYLITVDGTSVLLNSDDSSSDIESSFALALGSLPCGSVALLPTYTWDPDTLSYVSSTNSTYRTWMPERFAKPVTVFGSLPGPIEIEFTGMGLQYRDVTVTVGPDEYEEDPILVTVLVQGEGAQSTIWQLSVPLDTIDGSITLDGNIYSVPLDLSAIEVYLESEYTDCSLVTENSVTLITFDGSAPYQFVSFSSNTLCAATSSVLVTATGGLDGTLVIYDLVSGAGPRWFFSSQNWNFNSVPTDSDEIILDDASGDVRHGIDLVSSFIPCSSTRLVWIDRVNRFKSGQQIRVVHVDVTGTFYVRSPLPDGTFALSSSPSNSLEEFITHEEGVGAFQASIEISARFSGDIGLPEYTNGIPQYLPKYLAMYYTSLDLGNGPGDGLAMGRFDLSTNATSVIIHKSQDGDTYSAILLLVNSDTDITAANASVGIGEMLGESSIFNNFEGTSVALTIGRSVEYASVHNSGTTKHLEANRYFT